MKSRDLWIILAVAWVLAATSAGRGQTTVSFDFATGMGSNFTYSNGAPFSFTLVDSGGELRISNINLGALPSGGVYAGMVQSNFQLSGDFTLTLSYRSYLPLPPGEQIELFTNGVFVSRSNEPGFGGNNYHVYDGNAHNPQATSDLTGTLQLRRTGNVLSSYFGTTLIYSENFTTADVGFGFKAQANWYGGWGGGSIDVGFDNVVITAGGFTGLQSVPEPPLPMLIAAGMLMLLGRRWVARSRLRV